MILTVPLPFSLSVACCHFRSVSRVVRPRRRPTDVAFFTVTDSGRAVALSAMAQSSMLACRSADDGFVATAQTSMNRERVLTPVIISNDVGIGNLFARVRVEIGGAAFWTRRGSAVRTNESENSAVVLGFVA